MASISRSIPSPACTPIRALAILFVVFCFGSPAGSAADASYVGELGDTLALDGVSYTDNQVFLFMT